MKALSLILIGMMLWTHGEGADSTAAVKHKIARVRGTIRMHSLGQFNYGGRLVSMNPVADFTFTYERRTWGMLVFKAFDLVDHRTPINFTLAMVNKNFRLSSRFTITPGVGMILEQSHSCADHGSDLAAIIISSYKINKELTLEYSTLLGNLVITPEERDWVNRFRLLYSHKHWDVVLSAWHNNSVFDPAEYTTLGASTFYSRMKLSEHLSLNAGISGLIMPYSNRTDEVPKRNGVILTLAAVLQ